MSDDLLWIWMQQRFGVGTRRAHEALERYGSPDVLLARSEQELREDPFLDAADCRAILSANFSAARTLLAKEIAYGARVLTVADSEYPSALRQIYSPPLVLFTVGDLSLLREHYLITMVGTRTPDAYGVAAARKLSIELGGLGAVVVSGLAMGIDAVCHRGALDADGKTIAFLAAGLDRDYPAQNHDLRAKIEKNGLVLTEYPLGAPAMPGHFGIRNRMISGVSLATVLVQCTRRSGSMLTAAHALSQNRDIFAVPGDIRSPLMDGPHSLLRDGASPALSGEDILSRYVDVYGYPIGPAATTGEPIGEPSEVRRGTGAASEREAPSANSTRPSPREKAPIPAPDYLNERQTQVYSALCGDAVSVDDLCEGAACSPQELLTMLTQLELFGLVDSLPGRMFRAVQR